MKFKERLKQLREERGYSQRELASLWKMGQSTLGMYETGDREPSLEKVEEMANFFQVSSDYLLGLTDDCFGAKLPDLTKISVGTTLIQLRDGSFINLKDLSTDERKSIEDYILFVTKHKK